MYLAGFRLKRILKGILAALLRLARFLFRIIKMRLQQRRGEKKEERFWSKRDDWMIKLLRLWWAGHSYLFCFVFVFYCFAWHVASMVGGVP